jgi:hypothetical protein
MAVLRYRNNPIETKGMEVPFFQIIMRIDDPDIDAEGLSVILEEVGDIASIVQLIEEED